MYDCGLILEGGGLRGLYTAGVLDYFIEKDIEFSDIYGVSAGAFNAVSYITKQKERSKNINIGFVNDKRYLNMNCWKMESVLSISHQIWKKDIREIFI